MLKKSLLILAALVAVFQSQAAPVDVSVAKSKAKQYLASMVYAGKIMAPGATEPVLIKTEMGKVNQEVPVFYIFNTSTTFVVVSADDRAEEVLVVGDKPLSLDCIPDGLKDVLSCYTEEIDWLISNPDAQVEKPVSLKAPGAKAVTYGPLLTCNWSQTAPYYNQCKFTYNNQTYQCLTGCPATSASMVMYYWKWPTAQVGPLQGYTGFIRIDSSPSVSFTYDSLSATTFDWANMKDKYVIGYNGTEYTYDYTEDQAEAVATLMRYVGHAEHIKYGTSGSALSSGEVDNIVEMFTCFGYDSSTCRLVKKISDNYNDNDTSYSDTSWAKLIQNEMAARRPIVYIADDSTKVGYGHAFNIDGYRDSDNKYHANFGWGGVGNAWFTINSFSGNTFNYCKHPKAVIGIQPKILGDVNGDREVNIADINAIIDIILSGNTSSPNYGRADVNGDGEVNIADLNAIIDIILRN